MPLFEHLSAFIANMSGYQITALVLGILAIGAAKEILKNGWAVVCNILGVLAILYFISPQLYEIAYQGLAQGIRFLADLF